MTLRNAHLFAPYFVQLARKGVAKVSSELRRGQRPQSGLGPFHWLLDSNARLVQTLTEATQDQSSRLFDDGGVDRASVLHALRTDASDAYGQAVVMGRLLTADLALRDADA